MSNLHKHARLGGSEGMLPQEVLIRCPEIASEANLGQKQSHTSYLARGVSQQSGCKTERSSLVLQFAIRKLTT